MVQLNDSFFAKNDEKDISNWDASEKDWANAGNHRLLDYTYLSKDIGLTGYEVTNPKDEDLDVIKAAVNDGHILSITTWISGFELKNIEDTTLNPANKDFKGEVYITKIKSASGCHRMTIVGYNDDIWYDINGDGQVQEAEKGAFKIVNSWGKGYGTNGYYWLAYDALNQKSQVSDSVNTAERTRGAYDIICINVEEYDSDSEIRMVVSLNSGHRHKLNVEVTAKNKETGESKTQKMGCFIGYAKPSNIFSFEGTKTASDGTISLDLDRVAPEINSDNIDNYDISVKITNNADSSYPLIVKDVHVVDGNNGKIYAVENNTTQFPTTLVNSSKELKINTTENTDYVEVYYKGYTTPNIHFQQATEEWTTPPGYGMIKSDTLDDYTHKYFIYLDEDTESSMACFNDGYNTWDNNGEKNYTLVKGTCGIKDGVWTDVPGVKMEESSEVEGYPYKIDINMGTTSKLVLCFNDGNGNWDNNNSNDYTISAGTYTFANGKFTPCEIKDHSIEAPVFTAEADYRTVNLKWSATKNAVSYNIYGIQKDGDNDLQYMASTTDTEYTIDNLAANTCYKFLVSAVNQYGDESVWNNNDCVEISTKAYDALVNTSYVSQEAVMKQKVVFKGSATGGDGDYRFAYYYRKTTDSDWICVGEEFGLEKYATFKPGSNTVYEVCIKVMDGTGNIVKKYLSFAANKTATKLKCNGTITKTICKYGRYNRISASSEGASGTVKYKYEFRKASSWTYETIKDYSDAEYVDWKAPQTGAFTIRITAYDGTDYSIRTMNIKVKP